MLAAVKAFLHVLLIPTLYGGMWLTFFASIFKKAEWALYLLIILIPLPIIWYRFHDLPLGKDTMDILILGATLGIMVNKGGFQRAPSTFFIVLFMIVSYLAVWNTAIRFGFSLPLTTRNPQLTDWKNYAEMIFLYFVAYNAIRTEKEQERTVTLMAFIIFLVVFREFRNFTESAAFSYDKRSAGPFWIVGLGANHWGAFVAHFGGLLFGLYLADKHKRRKWLYLGAVILSLYSLFFSYSRGAYLAALVVVMVYGLLYKRSLLVGIVALVITWQAILPTTVVERITMTEGEGGEVEASAAHRLYLWQHAIQQFKDNPVFGIGFNAFGYTVPMGELTDTHNFYVKTAAEQGLIGLAVLALVLLTALLSGWRLFRSARSNFHRGLGLGFIGCTLAVAATNVFGDRWSYFMLGSYFWIFWGLVDRARHLVLEAPQEPPNENGEKSPDEKPTDDPSAAETEPADSPRTG